MRGVDGDVDVTGTIDVQVVGGENGVACHGDIIRISNVECVTDCGAGCDVAGNRKAVADHIDCDTAAVGARAEQVEITGGGNGEVVSRAGNMCREVTVLPAR